MKFQKVFVTSLLYIVATIVLVLTPFAAAYGTFDYFKQCSADGVSTPEFWMIFLLGFLSAFVLIASVRDFLRRAAHIPGLYVPSLYQVEYNEDGMSLLESAGIFALGGAFVFFTFIVWVLAIELILCEPNKDKKD